MQTLKLIHSIVMSLGLFTFYGCHDNAPIDESKLGYDYEHEQRDLSIMGGKLSQIAAHTIGDIDPAEPLPRLATLPEQAQAFVGRYVAHVSCQDAFIPCEQGSADYILTLLEDGTAREVVILSLIHI